MQSFRRALAEGRDAPLYHGTSMASAANILRMNEIVARTSQVLIHQMFQGKPDPQYPEFMEYPETKGVSLSRNYKFAMLHGKWGGDIVGEGVTFELNQTKLTQRYRLVPIEYFYDIRPEHSHYPSNRGRKVSEFEEFVIGPIKNLDQYITKIIIDRIDDIEKAPPSIAKHPKLYVQEYKRFLNV